MRRTGEPLSMEYMMMLAGIAVGLLLASAFPLGSAASLPLPDAMTLVPGGKAIRARRSTTSERRLSACL